MNNDAMIRPFRIDIPPTDLDDRTAQQNALAAGIP